MQNFYEVILKDKKNVKIFPVYAKSKGQAAKQARKQTQKKVIQVCRCLD